MSAPSRFDGEHACVSCRTSKRVAGKAHWPWLIILSVGLVLVSVVLWLAGSTERQQKSNDDVRPSGRPRLTSHELRRQQDSIAEVQQALVLLDFLLDEKDRILNAEATSGTRGLGSKGRVEYQNEAQHARLLAASESLDALALFSGAESGSPNSQLIALIGTALVQSHSGEAWVSVCVPVEGVTTCASGRAEFLAVRDALAAGQVAPRGAWIPLPDFARARVLHRGNR